MASAGNGCLPGQCQVAYKIRLFYYRYPLRGKGGHELEEFNEVVAFLPIYLKSGKRGLLTRDERFLSPCGAGMEGAGMEGNV